MIAAQHGRCPTCGAQASMYIGRDGLERLLNDLEQYPPTRLERIEVFLRRHRWALFIVAVVIAYVAGRIGYPV